MNVEARHDATWGKVAPGYSPTRGAGEEVTFLARHSDIVGGHVMYDAGGGYA